MTIENINELIIYLKNMDEAGVSEMCQKLGIEFTELDEGILGVFNLMEQNEELLSYFKGEMKKDSEVASWGADFIKSEAIAKELFENCEEYHLSSREIAKFAATSKDKDIIKQVVENREQYVFYSYELRNIIIASDDKEFIKEVIENREEFDFVSYELAELIVKVQDNELFKQCIENRQEFEMDDSTLAYQIIAKIEDKEFLKDYIEKTGKNEYVCNELAEIIAATDDVEFIKRYLKDSNITSSFYKEQYEKLISATHDTEFIRECIQDREKYKLESDNLKNIIISSNDAEFMKECVGAKEKCGLNTLGVVETIIATKDKDFMKSCVESHEQHELNEKNIFDVISATQDIEYMQACMRKSELELNKKYISILALKVNDEQYIEDEMVRKEYEKKIKLPSNMTIGVEIECEGEASDTIKNLSRIIADGWKCKDDGSLYDGVEIVSPILHSDSNDEKNINRVCSILNSCEQNISERCGGHIHIGADYLTSAEGYKVLSEIWCNSENILYKISNEQGTLPRQGTATYASPISQKIENAMRDGEIDLINIEDVEEFVGTLKNVQQGRYSGINFENIGKKGKNTIEFRLPNGTINQDIWIENINLFGGIIAAAEEISLIQKKPIEELNEVERKKLEEYEVILNGETDEKNKLEFLLQLVAPEEKENFLKRYEKNEPLVEQSNVMQSVYSKVAKGPVILTKKEIKKSVLEGENAIIGYEYKEAEEMINMNMLQRENSIELMN